MLENLFDYDNEQHLMSVRFDNYRDHIRCTRTTGSKKGTMMLFPKNLLAIDLKTNNDFLLTVGSLQYLFAFKDVVASQYYSNASELSNILTQWTTGTGDSNEVNEQKDASARTRVSIPHTLLDEQFQYSLPSDRFSTSIAGGALINYDVLSKSVQMSAGDTKGRCVLQTKSYLKFSQGNSLLVEFTCIMRDNLISLNNIVRVGLFDNLTDKQDNINGTGVFFELSPTGEISLVIRNTTAGSQTDVYVKQQDWDLDSLDGQGFSSYSLNPSKLNTYVFEISSDAGARIRAGVKKNGSILYCHSFNNNNAESSNITGLSLPGRFETFNVAPSSTEGETNNSFTHIYGIAAQVEGDFQPKLRSFAISRGPSLNTLVLQSSGQESVALALRLRADRCRSQLLPTNMTLLAPNSVNAVFHYSIIINPSTLSGGTWMNANVNSAAEYNITISSCSHDGTIIAAGYATDKTILNLRPFFPTCLSSDISGGARDTVILLVSHMNGAVSIYSSMEWCEHE